MVRKSDQKEEYYESVAEGRGMQTELKPCQEKHSEHQRRRKLKYQPEGEATGPWGVGGGG